MQFGFIKVPSFSMYFFMILLIQIIYASFILASPVLHTQSSSSNGRLSSSKSIPKHSVSNWHSVAGYAPYLLKSGAVSTGKTPIDELIGKHLLHYNSKPKMREKVTGSRISFDELAIKTGIKKEELSKILIPYYDAANLKWKSGKDDGSIRLSVYAADDKNLKYKYIFDPEKKSLLLYKKSEVTQMSSDVQKALTEFLPDLMKGIRTPNSYQELVLPKSFQGQEVKIKTVEYANKDGGFDQAYRSAKITAKPVLESNEYSYFNPNRYLKQFVTDPLIANHDITAKVKFRVNTDDGVVNKNDGTLFTAEVSHLGLGGVKFKPYEITAAGDKIALGFLGRYNHVKDGKLYLGLDKIENKVMESKGLQRKTKYVYDGQDPHIVSLLNHIENSAKDNVRMVPKPSREDLQLHAQNVIKDRSQKETISNKGKDTLPKRSSETELALAVGLSSLVLASAATVAATAQSESNFQQSKPQF